MKLKRYFILLMLIITIFFYMNSGSISHAAEGVGVTATSAVKTSAEVVAIEKETRTLTLLGTNGKTVTLKVGSVARNFDQIEIGDQLNVEFYGAVARYLGKPGSEPSAELESVMARSPKGDKPAGVLIETIDISAIVQAIDRTNRTLTLKGPEGKVKTIKVDDFIKAFDSLKVGDNIHVQYTEAMAISVEKP